MTVKSHKVPNLPVLRSAKGKASTGALIIEVLSNEDRCSLTQLHRQLFERFRYRISYQGVRKVVLGLVREGILKEDVAGFRISRQWLLQARSALDRLLTKTSSTRGTRQLVSLDGFDIYRADSLFSADTLWGDLLIELCGKHQRADRYLLSVNPFAFWMPLNLGRENEIFADLINQGWKVTFVFTKKSKLNDWARKLYKTIGVKAINKVAPMIPENTYYNVVGDSIIEVTLDHKLATLVKNISHKTGNQMNPDDLSQLAKTRGEVQLKMFENQILADSLRQIN